MSTVAGAVRIMLADRCSRDKVRMESREEQLMEMNLSCNLPPFINFVISSAPI